MGDRSGKRTYCRGTIEMNGFQGSTARHPLRRAAPVTLDQLAVGGIVERAVPALIAQPGQLRTSLLGMSFLNRLESWEVRGDRLVLRGQ